jgi:hypothetical protein
MPIGINTLELNEFFTGVPIPGLNNATGGLAATVSPFGSSVQKSWRYRVSILPDLFRTSDQNRANLYDRIGRMPKIRAWQCQSVTVPQYSFKKVTQYYGPVPRSAPEMDSDGFEVVFTFVEDDHGTILNLINWLQRSIINGDTGNYTPPDAVKIPVISVISENDNGAPIAMHTLHDAFYLNSTGTPYDYTGNDKITYNVTFNCDIINTFLPQSYIFSQLNNLMF